MLLFGILQKDNRSTKGVGMEEERPQLWVLSGASGVGKGTVLRCMKAMFPGQIYSPVSMTTRKPQEGEKNAVDYFFVNRDFFLSRRDNGSFVECAEYGGEL